MSKVFYDNLTSLKELETEINLIAESKEEKEELWNLVDELIHQRVLNSLLDELNVEHHEGLVLRLHNSPHDEGIWEYLKDKLSFDAKEFIRKEIVAIGYEILDDLGKNGQFIKKGKKTTKVKSSSKK